MQIKMAGIDYVHASIAQREAFALTKAHAAAMAKELVDSCGLDGCLILSTCNRTEFWISGAEQLPLSQILAKALPLFQPDYARFFTERNGKDAVDYLFRLACGMESQIFGEDQILGQIKEAASLARSSGSMDAVLEVLFRTAVTGAKAVKTQMKLTSDSHSAAEAAVALLKQVHPSLLGQKCLVIGNGEMGRLAARALVEQGADVSITLRAKGRHQNQDAIIPAHCSVVDYDQRVSLLDEFSLIVSATASPHCTLKWEEVAPVLQRPHVFLDLAVPRDIDPRIGSLPGVSLFDMDHLGLQHTVKPDILQQAEQILRGYQEEFIRWYEFREFIPQIHEISQAVAKDATLRLDKHFRQSHPEWEQNAYDAAKKAVAKLVYGLKETLPVPLWEPCLDALKQAVRPKE
ncbi:MAG: glutamyl-tRNA reductase [Clostridiales bacterium]|nr:glutamyl-tRNA reductase [Clostridiales bacterium]